MAKTKNKHLASNTPSGNTISNGGTARFGDNRNGADALRKVREGMSGSREDGKTVQLRKSMQEGSGEQVAPIQRKSNETGLPDQLKSGVESLSGIAMDDVKVHYNSSKPAQLKAHAYAQGTEIHLAPGQEKHLAHEAWHVVQQKQGRVQPTRQLKSKVNINDDAGLEHEADVMGAKALEMKAAGVNPAQAVSHRSAGASMATVQRAPDPDLENADKESDAKHELDNVVPLLGGKALLYLPETGKIPTQAGIYAHGTYAGETQPAVAGAVLNYTGPHQSIANASLSDFSSAVRINADEGDGNWHVYDLKIEEKYATNLDALFRVAKESGRGVVVVIEPTNTMEIVGELVRLGCNDILAIHCREVLGAQNTQVFADTGGAISFTSEWPRAQLNGWEYVDLIEGTSTTIVPGTPLAVGDGIKRAGKSAFYMIRSIDNATNVYTIENMDN